MSKKEFSRSKKLKLNTALSLMNQITAVVCGLILPRYILMYFGSDVNGLLSSITQFLALITFGDLGVDIVVQSSLYNPLAKNDMEMVSKIMISAKKFFNTIGFIMFGYIVVLLFFLPRKFIDDYSFLYTASLIVVMSINYFSQYFIGIRSLILLNADQRAYIQFAMQIAVTLLNTVLCIYVMHLDVSIQFVKLVTALVFLLKPIGMWFYIRKNYKIDYSLTLTEEPIKQKWNGLAQHIAFCVTQNTDVIVLSFFSTLGNISVYNIYNLVLQGIRQLIASISTGIQSFMGNMLANNEKNGLNKAFEKMEFLVHVVSVFMFSSTAVSIVPFVRVYTKGIYDVNYEVPFFAVLMTIATYIYCIRIPYNGIVIAAGHYKQTQKGAIVEMIINLTVSIVCVSALGLIGVAIGTLVALLYRTVYFAFYLRNNIINRSLWHFVKHIIVDFLIFAIVLILTRCIWLENVSYIGWVIMAIKVTIIAFFITGFVNYVCYRQIIKEMFFDRNIIYKENNVK